MNMKKMYGQRPLKLHRTLVYQLPLWYHVYVHEKIKGTTASFSKVQRLLLYEETYFYTLCMYVLVSST